MAAAVLRQRISAAGLHDQVRVESAGTSGWHVGAPADPRAVATLLDNGYEAAHRARRFSKEWAQRADLVLAMDASNYADLKAITEGTGVDLRMFREFDPLLSKIRPPNPALDVPDPYYGPDSGFTTVLAMLERAAEGIVLYISSRLEMSAEDDDAHDALQLAADDVT